MPIAFVDTAYLVAVLDPRDALHERALKVARDLHKRSARLVTSDPVLFELGNYFARSPLRNQAIDWIFALRSAPGWDIQAMSQPLVARAESL